MKIFSGIQSRLLLLSLPMILFAIFQQSCNSINENKIFENSFQFEYVDPLVKVLAEASYFPEKIALSEVVRGEEATLQFVVRSSKSISNLKAFVSPAFNGSKSLSDAKVGFVGYVKVGRTIWDYSRDRIVSQSGYYPDPILEQESINVDFGNAQPIWISIPVPINAEQGTYKGKIKITGKNGEKNFSISKDYSVKVYPVTVGRTSLWVTNWFSIDTSMLKQMAGGKAIEPYSEQHFGLIRTLARKMAEYRQNIAIISPLGLSKCILENGKWNIDFTNFDEVVNIFIGEGVVGRIEGGHIGGREGDWNSQFVVNIPNDTVGLPEIYDKLPISDKRAQAFYTDFITALKNHLYEKGWDKIYMQHIADEPTERNYTSYIEITKFVKKIAPDFKIIEACHSKNLGGLLDVWVPQLNFMNSDYEFYNSQNKEGKEAWFYTCLAPKGEYANRFIELPMLKTRYVHWLNYKYNVPGYLHWGLNYWKGDPFGEQTSINFEGGNILPGGDSWIIYPLEGRLLSSIRFEAMRDGIVDYELFKMLEKKDSLKARELVNRVIYSFEKYDNNVESFRIHRRNLMELLSE